MSTLDQCPSSKKEGKAGKGALSRTARDLPLLNGRAGAAPMWRSLEEAADTAEFRDFLEREFPAGASELNTATTRRTFLQIMGASVALAGAATIPGCRRPDHKILPFSARVPEDVIPGKPLYYATSMPLPGGGAEGLLIETHEGRPTKVEGNPLHPMNRGKSTTWSQASVLNMYDPDRLKFPVYQAAGISPRAAKLDEDFRPWAKEHFGRIDAARGKGLAFLVDKKTGPAREAVAARIKQRFPDAMWVPYSPAESDSAALGTAAAFGAPMREQLTFSAGGEIRAKVIVSLDRDFLCQSDPGSLRHAREFAATRRVLKPADPMSRLYVVESGFSETGSAADHRLRLAPSRVTAFAVMLAKALLAKAPGANMAAVAQALDGLTVPEGSDIPAEFVNALADDLIAADDGHGGSHTRAGETLIVAGPSQPAGVHALCHALNAALGNIGRTISYIPMTADEAAPSAAGIKALAEAMGKGEIKTLVCINTNPVYDAPADVPFAEAFKKVTSITLSVEATETAAVSNWSLNGAHYLESWGDTESWDGAVAPVQPMIAPLYDPALSDIELLALIADPNAGILPPAAAEGSAATGTPKQPRVDDGHQIVRTAWRARLGGGVNEAAFEKLWRRALHDGVCTHQAFAKSAQAPTGAGVRMAAIAAEVAKLKVDSAPSESSLDVVFGIGHIHDGRFANNGWLQELPQHGTRLVWDNPALLSPKTAEKLNLLPESYSESDPNEAYTQKYPAGRMATLTINGRSMEIAVWVLPGMADDTVALMLGYGRGGVPGHEGQWGACGRVGDGVGFNTYKVRDSASGAMAGGAKLARSTTSYPLSSTQNHWTMGLPGKEDRRSILRHVDLAAWQKFGGEKPLVEKDRLYATQKDPLNFGERVGHGELTHTPANIGIYPNPFADSGNHQRPGDRLPDAPKSVDGNLFGKRNEPEPGSVYATGPQWGMSIDLTTCTGCGTCTIACQSENNIPVVGKKEVAKGREMTWIRVDRYYTGHDLNNPDAMLHQPIACVHCENAPCETVCPVNATVHGPEGMNYMTYNRCIGTRYCANNCPYKVRRFNFFDYGVTKFNGDYYFKDVIEAVPGLPGHGNGSTAHNKHNPNLIPPRLREKLDQVSRMQKNPDVTVRSRGVMEKCSYCIQRVNAARVEMKVQKLERIPDGFVQAACQQACPSGAISFGDILDTASNKGQGSEVRQMRENQRSYLLLGFLNTRPRTTHMVRVSNPNPRLVSKERKKYWDDPFGHHGSHGDHGHGGESHSMSRSSFLRDAAKRLTDRGYALTLKVLNA